MGTRARLGGYFRDEEGEPLAGSQVFIFQQHSTTDQIDDAPVSATIYTHDSDHPSLSAATTTLPLTTANDGSWGLFTADAMRVDIKVVTDGKEDEWFYGMDISKNPSSSITIQEEGTDLAQRNKINFIGATVTAADDAANGRTNVTITAPTAGITVSENGTPLDTDISTLDFLGADFDLTESPENEANVALAADVVRDADLAAYQALSEKGQNDGYASLDAGGDVPLSELGNVPAPAFVGCEGVKTSAQTISTAGAFVTALTFTTESKDSGFHDNVTNPDRFTVPAGQGGTYLVKGKFFWTGNVTGDRFIVVTKNGIGTEYRKVKSVGLAHNHPQDVSCLIDLVAGDYVGLAAYQTSGGNLDVLGGGSYDANFIIVKQ